MSSQDRRDGEFTATQMKRLLDLVSTKLAARGVPALVYVVGGAAIAFRHDDRRTTDDIDGLAVPPGEVLAAWRAAQQDSLFSPEPARPGSRPHLSGVARRGTVPKP